MDSKFSQPTSTANGLRWPQLVYQVSLLNLMKPGAVSPLLTEAYELALSTNQPVSLAA